MLQRTRKAFLCWVAVTLLALCGLVVAGSIAYDQLQLIQERGVVLWPHTERLISTELIRQREETHAQAVLPTLRISNHGLTVATYQLSLLARDLGQISLTQGNLGPGESAYFTLAEDSLQTTEESSHHSLFLEATSGKHTVRTWLKVGEVDALTATKLP